MVLCPHPRKIFAKLVVSANSFLFRVHFADVSTPYRAEKKKKLGVFSG